MFINFYFCKKEGPRTPKYRFAECFERFSAKQRFRYENLQSMCEGMLAELSAPLWDLIASQEESGRFREKHEFYLDEQGGQPLGTTTVIFIKIQ